ncbi:MAG TPA: type II toxin-antitoxin system HicA family toxin [Verrucomicrobiae bacterium]|nr:type II toxin-antitoxin system HicA family toxin [Verrucomicrobiae bacterium]
MAEGPKVRDVIERLLKDGWYLDRQSGSHRQYRHDTKQGLVTIAGALGTNLPIGTYKNIMKQAGWKR